MVIKLLSKIDFSIDSNELKKISFETKLFLDLLRKTIKKLKIRAEPFVGGSFAKGTMAKSNNYDVDIFIRFDNKYGEDISSLTEKIIKNAGLKYNKLHGSRDYFQVEKLKGLTFEVIPVLKINKAREAKNTTDLSYFHVRYVKGKISINKKLAKEICLAKQFFKSAKVYGAESYVSGFSGYAVECLIIYYKSFEKMLKAFFSDRKIIIDPENQYKKQVITIEMNEAKQQSPIILVDPTWKERNVLAALNSESFERLKEKTRLFLKKPSVDFFEIKEINESELRELAKNKNSEFVKITLKTDKQPGDIAGTKLKKFSRHLIEETKKYFDIIKDEFDYRLKEDAALYLVAKSKKEIVEQGPPIRKGMEKHVDTFKKRNKYTFIKAGSIYAKIKLNFSLNDFIQRWISSNQKKLKDMDVTGIKVN